MNCSITSRKSEDTAHHPDKERQALRGEFSEIQELGEYFRCSPMVSHVSKRDQNGEEAEDMEDEDETLKTRQEISANTID